MTDQKGDQTNGAAASRDDRPFEAVLDELEQTVERLERGSLPLAEGLAAFERGMALVETADERLTRAEARVEALVRGADGGDRTAPFEEAYPDLELEPSGD